MESSHVVSTFWRLSDHPDVGKPTLGFDIELVACVAQDYYCVTASLVARSHNHALFLLVIKLFITLAATSL